MTSPSTDPDSVVVDAPLRDLLRPILAGRRRQIVAVSASAILMGLSEAFVLVLVTQIAFAMSQGNDAVAFGLGPVRLSPSLGTAFLVATGLVVVRGGFQILNGWQSSHLVTDVLARSRHEMTDAFLNSSWTRQSQEQGGRLQELLTTYVSRVSGVVDALTKGITSGFSLASLMVTAVVVSPVAAGSLIVALVVLAVTLQPLRGVIRKASRHAADTNLDFATGVSEISGIGREVQVFGVEQEVGQHIHGLVDQNAVAMRRQNFISFMFTPLYASVVLLLLVGALAGIWALGVDNLASLGAVMVVMIRSLAYAQLAQGVYGSLHGNAPYMADLGRQLDSYRDDAVDRTGTSIDAVGAIRFDHVSFSYEEEGFALDDVSFEIGRGEAIGIIGPSGSGKSTLIQLLLRLRSPSAGAIQAGGIPVDEIAMDDWRRTVAFVPQDVKLISGSIADNIRFYRPEVGRAQIEEAARSAHVHDEIAALPLGYDTLLGGANAQLSGGQQQRVCIARSLVSTPSLLVLDEPTSALDMRSEARVRDTLAAVRGEVAVVIIAHRLSTLDMCDRIMVIQDGRLLAFDRPEALRGSNEFYQEALELSGLR
ncbi:ABC transporter ATP-binding protein [soil metagenome]